MPPRLSLCRHHHGTLQFPRLLRESRRPTVSTIPAIIVCTRKTSNSKKNHLSEKTAPQSGAVRDLRRGSKRMCQRVVYYRERMRNSHDEEISTAARTKADQTACTLKLEVLEKRSSVDLWGWARHGSLLHCFSCRKKAPTT